MNRLFRPTSLAALLLIAGLSTARCGDDDPITPTEPSPTEFTENFADSLTLNGGITHQFVVQRAGNVAARISALTPSDAVIGLSLGPLSSQGCTQAIANDAASSGTVIVGTATSLGNFCVRVYDSRGQLSGAVSYELTVTHF